MNQPLISKRPLWESWLGELSKSGHWGDKLVLDDDLKNLFIQWAFINKVEIGMWYSTNFIRARHKMLGSRFRVGTKYWRRTPPQSVITEVFSNDINMQPIKYHLKSHPWDVISEKMTNHIPYNKKGPTNVS